MTYDAARREVVMFGGSYGGGFLNDTWTWDGTIWTQQFETRSPTGRFGMGMTYDAARREVVLFGGCCFMNDTWILHGKTWRGPRSLGVPDAPAPTPRRQIRLGGGGPSCWLSPSTEQLGFRDLGAVVAACH